MNVLLQRGARAAAVASAASVAGYTTIAASREDHTLHRNPRAPLFPAVATTASCEGDDGALTSVLLWASMGAVAAAGAAWLVAGSRGMGNGSGAARPPVELTAQEQLDRAASLRAEIYASRNEVLDEYADALNAAAPEWVARRADLPVQPSNGWGTQMNADRSFSYVGEFKDGEIEGQGKRVLEYLPGAPDTHPSIRRTSNERRYITTVGHFKEDGTFEGMQMHHGLTSRHALYVGQTTTSYKHGQGSEVIVYDDGTWEVYAGGFKKDEFHGHGTWMNSAGDQLTAIWVHRELTSSGRWVRVSEDGTVESGKIVNGQQTHADGTVENGKIFPGSIFTKHESSTARPTGSQASEQK